MTRERLNISAYPNLIGFDQLFADVFNLIKTDKNDFPPHNLVKTDENSYILTLAVVGRDKEEINIELIKNKLIISAKSLDFNRSYNVIHNDIAFRAFKKEFNLNENVVVKDAKLSNGLLNIYLEQLIPEIENTSKYIKIS